MNRLIAVCFFVILTVTVVDAQCTLSQASMLAKQRQFPRFINRDKRNYVEYNVTYRNFSSNLAIFSTTNTSRFQQWRWFNVNDEAIDELKLIYDSNFYVFGKLFDIKRVHIEIIIDPIECLYTLDSEELENLTRNFFLKEIELTNPKICSAHIYDDGGTGDISMKCCELTTVGMLNCTDTNGENTLFFKHLLAIIVSILIVITLFFSWNLIDLGSEDFYFYPKDMIITNKFKQNQNNVQNAAEGQQHQNNVHNGAEGQQHQNNIHNGAEGQQHQNNVHNGAEGQQHQNNVHNGAEGQQHQNNVHNGAEGQQHQNNVHNGAEGQQNNIGLLNSDRTQSKTVNISDSIKGLEELKQKLENSSHGKKYKVESITLSVNKRKCIGNRKLCISFLRCLKEPLNDITNCYCTTCEKTCNCSCSRNSRYININAGGVYLVLILIVLAIPLGFIFHHLMDSDSENLCTNYAKKNYNCPFYLQKLPLVLLCFNALLYCILLLFFFLDCCGKRFLDCCGNRFNFFNLYVNSYDVRTEFKKCYLPKFIFSMIISLILIGNLLLTMYYGVYFLVYSFIRVFITCLRTKDKYDELILAILPVLFIFIGKINNVTEKYKAIVEVVLNFINKQNNKDLVQQRQQCRPAIVFSPNSNNDSTCEVEFPKCCKKLFLKINRPLIFIRLGKPELLSKRFISQLYSKTSDCMECELNHYLKAILFSIIPCAGFVLIFFLFLNFGTIYSYSTQVTEYIAIAVTVLSYFKWFPAIVKGEYLVSEISKDWLEREMTDTLENYEESWMISDFNLSPLPTNEPQNEHEQNFVFTYESRNKKPRSVTTLPL